MSAPERPPTETPSEVPQPASPSQQASPSSEASASGPVTEETVQPVKEAAFEPLRRGRFRVPRKPQSALPGKQPRHHSGGRSPARNRQAAAGQGAAHAMSAATGAGRAAAAAGAAGGAAADPDRRRLWRCRCGSGGRTTAYDGTLLLCRRQRGRSDGAAMVGRWNAVCRDARKQHFRGNSRRRHSRRNLFGEPQYGPSSVLPSAAGAAHRYTSIRIASINYRRNDRRLYSNQTTQAVPASRADCSPWSRQTTDRLSSAARW